jgi:predicted Zn-dependent protease
MRGAILILLAAPMLGMTTTVADGNANERRAAYEYTADETNAAARTDLDLALAPFRLAGKLNRNTPELERVRHLFAQLVDVAKRRSDFARTLDWAVYVHEGRLVEAYSRAGGRVVISAQFLDRYRPNDAELAFVIGHEIAHALCEHERVNLSAVWRRNAPHQLAARYAMEFLDTEPMVRAQIAPIARLQERVADRIGLELAAAAGFDPTRALGFFDKSADQAQGGGIFPDMHDAPVQRKTLLLRPAAPYRTMRALFRGRAIDCAPEPAPAA